MQIRSRRRKDNEALKTVSYVQKNPATLASDVAIAIATGARLTSSCLTGGALCHEIYHADTAFGASGELFTSTFLDEGRIFTAPGGTGHGVPFLVDPLVLSQIVLLFPIVVSRDHLRHGRD